MGWLHRKHIKTAKMAACCDNFHCGDDFDAVLVIFCSSFYGANDYEAVEKIITDAKDYQKFLLCDIVCIATAYQ